MQFIKLNNSIHLDNKIPSREIILRELTGLTQGKILADVKSKVNKVDSLAIHYTTTVKPKEDRVLHYDKHFVSHFIIGKGGK